MRVAIAGADAVRMWRDCRFSTSLMAAQESLPVDFCPTIKAVEAAFLAKRFGILPPLRCIVPSDSLRRNSSLLDCHVLPASIPNAPFVPFGVESYVSAPALALLQAANELSCKAARSGKGSFFSDQAALAIEKSQINASAILLTALATELSSNYALDLASHDGFSSRRPAMTIDDARCFDGVRYLKGIRLFSLACEMMLPNSNSPGESSLGLIMRLPVEFGGLGISGVRMNYPVETICNRRHRLRYIDICIPEQQIAIEFNSKAYHAGERANLDEERRNEIASLGFSVFVITPEILFDADRLEECLLPVIRKTGARLSRSADYKNKRADMRALIFEVNNTVCAENKGSMLGDRLRI